MNLVLRYPVKFWIALLCIAISSCTDHHEVCQKEKEALANILVLIDAKIADEKRAIDELDEATDNYNKQIILTEAAALAAAAACAIPVVNALACASATAALISAEAERELAKAQKDAKELALELIRRDLTKLYTDRDNAKEALRKCYESNGVNPSPL